MTESITTFSWRFGGPLAGLAPGLAWTLLGVTAALGAAWIMRGYHRTLVALAPTPRRVLTALRLILWLGILVALAGPTRVERAYSKREARPLAVLVDRSASMTTPDNRRQTRADDALRRWRALAPAAAKVHAEQQAFAFADTTSPAALANPDAVPGEEFPASQTRLFGSIDRLLASAPPGGWGGIVALTDGLDTASPDPSGALAGTARAALAAGTPLYLVPGRNRQSGGVSLAFRDLVLPTQTPPRSTFRLEVTLDTYQPKERSVPVRIREGVTWRTLEPLALPAGRRLLPYSVEIAAREPGALPLELRFGAEPDAPSLLAEVRVAAPTSTRILYYQGALDWGYRFLADILRRDPAFALTPIFNLAPPGTTLSRRAVATRSDALPALPETAAGYANFDIVILANARADQFTPAQQAALSAWVRDGGVVLFLAPDDDATRGFAGSELEKMLPVVFPGSDDAAAPSAALADFREQMRRNGGSNISIERTFAENSARERRLPSLAAFSWEPRARALLGSEVVSAAPRFANYARIQRAKPGADILARHPRDRAPNASSADDRAVLLALQRYGRGQSAVLASDALWRWKLNQPSRERGAELFWQNLLAWLGRESSRGPRFERPPLAAEPGREIMLRVIGADSGLSVQAALDPAPSGVSPAPLFPAGEDNGASLYRWTPATEGRWVISVRGPAPSGAAAPVTRHWIDVARRPTGEASGQPADETVLRALAERTGGAVLDTVAPAAWTASRADEPDLLKESAEPVWHQGWIFAALLGVYAIELILRRRQKLL